MTNKVEAVKLYTMPEYALPLDDGTVFCLDGTIKPVWYFHTYFTVKQFDAASQNVQDSLRFWEDLLKFLYDVRNHLRPTLTMNGPMIKYWVFEGGPVMFSICVAEINDARYLTFIDHAGQGCTVTLDELRYHVRLMLEDPDEVAQRTYSKDGRFHIMCIPACADNDFYAEDCGVDLNRLSGTVTKNGSYYDVKWLDGTVENMWLLPKNAVNSNRNAVAMAHDAVHDLAGDHVWDVNVMVERPYETFDASNPDDKPGYGYAITFQFINNKTGYEYRVEWELEVGNDDVIQREHFRMQYPVRNTIYTADLSTTDASELFELMTSTGAPLDIHGLFGSGEMDFENLFSMMGVGKNSNTLSDPVPTDENNERPMTLADLFRMVDDMESDGNDRDESTCSCGEPYCSESDEFELAERIKDVAGRIKSDEKPDYASIIKNNLESMGDDPFSLDYSRSMLDQAMKNDPGLVARIGDAKDPDNYGNVIEQLANVILTDEDMQKRLAETFSALSGLEVDLDMLKEAIRGASNDMIASNECGSTYDQSNATETEMVDLTNYDPIEDVMVSDPDRHAINLARRIMKCSEELGEATQAYLSVTSDTNPKNKTWDDVREELVDLAACALDCAFTPIKPGETSETAYAKTLQWFKIKNQKWRGKMASGGTTTH